MKCECQRCGAMVEGGGVSATKNGISLSTWACPFCICNMKDVVRESKALLEVQLPLLAWLGSIERVDSLKRALEKLDAHD